MGALDGYDRPAHELGESIRGALTVYVEDSTNGDVYVLTDIFGSSMVFQYASDQDIYISSSLPKLLSVLTSMQIKPEKSLKYAAMLASSNSGGLIDAPYVGMQVLGQFEYLKIQKSRLSSETYPLRDRIFEELRGYKTDLGKLRQLVVTDIANNVAAASEYQTRSHICHISGRLEERVLLAAIRKSGFEHVYTMHLAGSINGENAENALGLAGNYKYPVSGNPGYEIAMMAGEPTEDSRWRLHETAGLLLGPATPGLRSTNSLVLTAGFSKMFRDPWGSFVEESATQPSSQLQFARSIMGPLGNARGDTYGTLLSDSLITEVMGNIESIFKKIRNFNLPHDVKRNFLWLATQGRYLDGETSRSLSPYVARFDPLYSPWLLPTSWSYSKTDRARNYLPLDIISDLDMEIVSFPYNKAIEVEPYFSERPLARRRSFNHPPSDIELNWSNRPSFVSHRVTQEYSQEELALASRLGIPVRNAAYANTYRRSILEFMEIIDDEVLEECFNLSSLNKLLRNSPRRLADYRAMKMIHDCLAWYVQE
ncbi:hypothetical protein ACFO7V_04970 [Glutamicibacter bergerei]|uniref:Serine hydrolase n=1 Tax=Glutamicibacter bergerei TaxID=256702 RepID=A0ABV9MK15_9MICC